MAAHLHAKFSPTGIAHAKRQLSDEAPQASQHQIQHCRREDATKSHWFESNEALLPSQWWMDAKPAPQNRCEASILRVVRQHTASVAPVPIVAGRAVVARRLAAHALILARDAVLARRLARLVGICAGRALELRRRSSTAHGAGLARLAIGLRRAARRASEAALFARLWRARSRLAVVSKWARVAAALAAGRLVLTCNALRAGGAAFVRSKRPWAALEMGG